MNYQREVPAQNLYIWLVVCKKDIFEQKTIKKTLERSRWAKSACEEASYSQRYKPIYEEIE